MLESTEFEDLEERTEEPEPDEALTEEQTLLARGPINGEEETIDR
jgi:hypothetical protein